MAKRGVKIDRIGQKFNMLTIIKSVPRLKKTGKRERTYWVCRCDCGSVKRYVDTALVSGRTKSCGCYRKSINHGLSKIREYIIWSGMKNRCYNKNNDSYKHYGGRGITICERWRESYFNFLSDMGKSPSSKHSIDRIDVNGNYEPDNCRWATMKEQSNNTRKTVLYKLCDREDTISGWAEVFGMKYSALYTQLVRFGRDISDVAFKIDYKLTT